MTESTPLSTAAKRRPLGLPLIGLVGLALLAVPRVVLHDLRLVTEEHPLTWLLALGPVVVWIAVAVAKRVPQPFLTLLVVGAIYGVFLMLSHLLLWDQLFGDRVPDLGGPAGEIVPRVATAFSSIFTGTLVGAVAGLAAWGISAILKRRAGQ